MPKINYDKSKGLHQVAGQGQSHELTANSTDDTIAIKSSQNTSKVEYRVISEAITLGDSSTTTQGAAGFIPLGMIVLGGELRITTAGVGANAAPTKLGDGSDDNHYGDFTLNTTGAVGTSVLLVPTDLTPQPAAARLTVTHSSVTQTTDAVVTVTLYGLIPVKG